MPKCKVNVNVIYLKKKLTGVARGATSLPGPPLQRSAHWWQWTSSPWTGLIDSKIGTHAPRPLQVPLHWWCDLQVYTEKENMVDTRMMEDITNMAHHSDRIWTTLTNT